MADRQILETIRSVVADVIDDEEIGDITEATTAEDIEGWDSLAHVRIIMALERKYNIRFQDAEIESLQTVGDLAAAVSRNLPSGA